MNSIQKQLGGVNNIKNKSHVSSDDKFYKYIHDIRNMRKLNADMLSNINAMSNADKMEIIITFNDVVEGLVYLISDTK